MVSSYHVHDKYALYVKLFYHCFFFFFCLIDTDVYRRGEKIFGMAYSIDSTR